MKIDKNQKEIEVLLQQAERLRNQADNAVARDGDYLALQKEARESGCGFVFYPNCLEFGYYIAGTIRTGEPDLFSISTAGEILYPRPPDEKLVKISKKYRKILNKFFEKEEE